MSRELDKLLNAQGAVIAAARKTELPAELAALPGQAEARLAAVGLAAARSSGELQSGGALTAPKDDTLQAALERAIAAAYEAVQKIDDEKTLRVVGRVMAGDGQSLALLRRSMNRSPVPSAFETGKAP